MAGRRSKRGNGARFPRVRALRAEERGTLSLKEGAAIRAVLVYPNRYEVGMASLGFQTVYRLWNSHPSMRCERAFVDDSLYEGAFRSFETGRALGAFDLIGYSVSFELDIPNVIRSLRSSRIPLFATERAERDPVVFVGGAVASLNPSPLLPFIDGLQVGEGEGLLLRMGDILSEGRQDRWTRRRTMEALSRVRGLFIPGLSGRGIRNVLPSLDGHPVFTPIVTPSSHFSDMFVVETGRGCRRGCYFCGGQKVYTPYRVRSREVLLDTVERFNPGAGRVGLEGAGLSDYPGLEGLCDTILGRGLKVSFSSLRPDRVSAGLMEIIRRSGIRTFTMAPETGSESLRRRIGKGISDDGLMKSVRMLAGSSVQVLKLYFLIGIPGESEEDVRSVPELVRALAGEFLSGYGRRSVRLSVNAFVPKPFTEFQWAGMDGKRAMADKRKIIGEGVRGVRGVSIATKSGREELFQGALSVGSEKVGHALAGMILDGSSWTQACRRNHIDLERLVHRGRSQEEELPWDWMEYPVEKDILWRRYQRFVEE